MTVFIVIAAVVGTLTVLGVLTVNKLIQICGPNEVLVISGGTHRAAGRTVGYKDVQGGRALVIPLLEKVDRLDLTNMIIDVGVTGAYSKGGIPLNVEAVANVKVASTQPILGNAIERFLGKRREEIVRVAKETLEGNLRGVLATLTPEEVNNDRVKFAQSLLHEADGDLQKLGLALDTLKIQNVSDDKGYLDSIGRKQSADLVMRSRIAEAENQAASEERDAQNYETRMCAKLEAEIEIARADAERRILDARTKGEAMVEEQRGQVTALVAEAQAEVEVQRARIEQVRLRLAADRVKPAEAARDQMIATARGESAQILEEGKATARSLLEVSRSWRDAGPDARRAFVAQKMGTLVDQMLDTVEDMPIDEITVIDQRLGDGNLASRARVASEMLEASVGVDVPQVLKRLASGAFGETDEAPPNG
jgi:flotillin